jgi:hypothetical protein
VLLAFSLAMTLQRIQRKQRKAAAAKGGGGEGAGAGPPPRSYAVGSAPHAGIQLSPQHSPGAASSVCSADDLLASDAEGGLVGASRKRLLQQQASSSGGAVAAAANGRATASRAAAEVTPDELRRTSQFGLAHPQNGGLQVGAEKLQEDEQGEEDGWPGRHAARHGGDLGAVDSGEPRGGCAAAAPGNPLQATQPGSALNLSTRASRARPIWVSPAAGLGWLHAAPARLPLPLPAATLQEAAWAMKFAFAAYGYLLFLFSEPT